MLFRAAATSLLIHNHRWPNTAKKWALYSSCFINHIVLVLRVFRQSRDKIMPSRKYYESHLWQENHQTRCEVCFFWSPLLKLLLLLTKQTRCAGQDTNSNWISSNFYQFLEVFIAHPSGSLCALCSAHSALNRLTKTGKWNAKCVLDITLWALC